MSEAYHLSELSIALDPANPAHILPPPISTSQQVLDVGCGAGQTLIAAYSGRTTFGIDADLGALQLGQTLTRDVRFACGRGEALPFRDASFDLIICRASLAYMNIPATLNEIRRVLKPAGALWLTLHPFSVPWNTVKRANYKGKFFFVYIVVNSLLFHFFQVQVSALGTYESFQTEWGIRRALRRSGFQNISIARDRHFLVTARVRDGSSDVL